MKRKKNKTKQILKKNKKKHVLGKRDMKLEVEPKLCIALTVVLIG